MNANVALEEVVTESLDVLGETRFALQEEHRLKLVFDLSRLPRYYCDAMNIVDGATLMVTFLCVDRRFGGGCPPDPRSHISEGGSNLTSKLTYQLSQLVHEFNRQHWPPDNLRQCRRYFILMHHFLAARLTCLGDYCIVCSTLQKYPGIKPVPCDNPACSFAYEEMGIGGNIVGECHTRPLVVDLLISMAAAAAQSATRREYLFATVPTDFLLLKQPGKYEERCVNWPQLIASFQSLPTVEDMADVDKLSSFSKSDPPGFKLFQWVLNSCRGHLMPVPEHARFTEIGASQQFCLCSTTAEREHQFKLLKSGSGSCYLWHGSPSCNWHAIVREGLKNCSHTPLMSTGAAYGAGIYLAGNSSVSSAYSSSWNSSYCTSQVYSNSVWKAGVSCIALCEVANSALRNHMADIYTVANEEAVIIRYIFILDSSFGTRHAAKKVGAELAPFIGQLESDQTSLFKISEELKQQLTSVELIERSRAEKRKLEMPASTSSDEEENDFCYSSGDDAIIEDSKANPSTQPIRSDLEDRFTGRISGDSVQLRLMKELRSLSQSNTRSEGFEVEPVGDDLTLWEGKMWIDKDCSLGKDLEIFGSHHGQDYVKMRIRFGETYPNDPPTMWVVSPIFQRGTGFVSGGAICTTMLVSTGASSGWSSVYTTEILMRQIRANFHLPDANGRIQNPSQYKEYSEEEARAGWYYARIRHGWNT